MVQTPNPSRRSWVGPPPPPFLTPRPERRHLELRWSDGGSHSSVRRSGVGAGGGGGGSERDREANVQVVLRCRPLSEEEQKTNVQSAISCSDLKREVTVLHSLFKQADKTFTFDKDFYRLVATQFDTKVMILRIDNVTEYVNKEFAAYLSVEGIFSLLENTTSISSPTQSPTQAHHALS